MAIQDIQLRRSETAGNTPSGLSAGEPAINIADGDLYFGDPNAVNSETSNGILKFNLSDELAEILSNGNTMGGTNIDGGDSASVVNLTSIDASTGSFDTVTDDGAGSINMTSALDLDSTLNVLNGATFQSAVTAQSGLDMSSTNITNVADPTNAQDAATKAYVDAIEQSLDIKDAARLGSDTQWSSANNYDSTNQSISAVSTGATGGGGGPAVDGVEVAAGDRLMAKNGIDEGSTDDPDIYNGIWVVDSVDTTNGTMTISRASDMNEDAEVNGGEFTFIQEGTNNGDNGFVVTSDSPTLDTNVIIWTQFSGAGQITAGDGLTKSGNTIDAVSGDNSITMNADSFTVNPDGTTLETDATNGLQIAATAAGAGLIGGGGSALDIGDGDGITVNVDEIEATVDGTTIDLSATDGTGAIRIASSAAGSGLGGGGGSALTVNTGNTLEVVSDNVQVAIDTGSIRTSAANATSPLTDTMAGLNVAIDNDSVVLDANNALAVGNVDGGTF